MNNLSVSPHPYLPLARVSLRALVWALLTGVALALPALYLLRLLPLPTPDEAAAGFKILHDEFPARRVARFSADATVAVAQVSA